MNCERCGREPLLTRTRRFRCDRCQKLVCNRCCSRGGRGQGREALQEIAATARARTSYLTDIERIARAALEKLRHGR